MEMNYESLVAASARSQKIVAIEQFISSEVCIDTFPAFRPSSST